MANDDRNEEGQGFKIIDRRRYDSEGQLKEETKESTSSSAGKQHGVASSTSSQQEDVIPEGSFTLHDPEQSDPFGDDGEEFASAEQAEGGYPPLTFGAFVVSLATQAMWQLGVAPPPPGVKIPLDRAAAKQTIDLLAMLQEKTRGNLEQDEADQLEEILHSMRMVFIRR